MKKIILGIIFLILIIGTVSAMEWDNWKDYNEKTKEITITNAFGLGDDLAKYKLTYNTDQCLINCYAEGTATLYTEGYLFTDLRFKDAQGDWTNIKSNDILIKGNKTYEKKILEYKETCETLMRNESLKELCYDEVVGSHQEQYGRWELINYQGELLPAGNYEWRVEGRKGIAESIDWIASSFGEDFTEWAWWNANWVKRKKITLTNPEASAHFSEYVEVNVTDISSAAGNYSKELALIDNSSNQIDMHIIVNGTDWAYIAFNMNISASEALEYYIYYDNSAATEEIEVIDFTANATDGRITWDFETNVADTIPNTTGWVDTGGTQNLQYWNTTTASAVVGTLGLENKMTVSSSGGIGKNFTTSDSETQVTFCTWYKHEGVGADDEVIMIIDAQEVSGDKFEINMDADGAEIDIDYLNNAAWADTGVNYPTNEYHYFCFEAVNITTGHLWIDGYRNVSYLHFDDYTGSNFKAVMFSVQRNSGMWDEIKVFKGRYYGLNNITYTLGSEESSGLVASVTLDSPTNNTAFINNYNSFTANFTASMGNLTNATLYIWDSGGTLFNTNTTIIFGQSNQSTLRLSEFEALDYKWNYEACADNSTASTCSFGSSNWTFTPNNFTLGLCNTTNNVPYLNFTYMDEADSTLINASTDLSIWTYNLDGETTTKSLSFTNTSLSSSTAFCVSPPNITVEVDLDYRYSATGYPQRTFTYTNQDLTNTTTNRVLYLLSSSDGLYVTFQVVNPSNQVLSNVSVNITRSISGTDVNVGSGTTDDAGTATFWLNPVYSHTLTFSRTGFTTETLTIFPAQSSYTVTMGGTETQQIQDYTYGMSVTINPPVDNILYNDTTYNFNMTISTSYWDLDNFGFTLKLNNGTNLGFAHSTDSDGGTVGLNQDTSNYQTIIMEYYYTVNSTNQTSTARWNVINTEYTSWSISYFIDDFKAYLAVGMFGLDNFGVSILIYLIMFISIGIMSYKYGLNNPLVISLIVFGIVYFFDISLGLLTSPEGAVPHLYTWLSGVITAVFIIREVTK